MKRATLQEVADILDSRNMESETTGIGISSSDPVVETAIRLSLDELVEYDRNPRTAANREYEALKESLRSTGSGTVALVVTKRPGESHYFPMMGGNTRIRVLKELYAETGDEEKYFWLSCKFRPFGSEAELLIGHLAENDNRADYIFLDRARGIRAIREQFEAEDPEGEALSQRRFIALLTEHGYPRISQSSLSKFNYVLDVLHPLIPQALESGLSDGQTRKIRKLQKQIEEFCKRLFTDEALLEQLLEIFPESLSRLDADRGIDLQELESKTLTVLSSYIARMEDADQPAVHRQLLSHWALHLQDPSLTPSWPESRPTVIDLGDQDDDDHPGPGDQFETAINMGFRPADPDAADAPLPAPPSREHSSAQPPVRPESTDRKLARLREEAYHAALSILQEHAAEGLLRTDPDCWLGFWIALPDLRAQADPVTGPRADIWWWLYLLTESDRRVEEFARTGEDGMVAELGEEMARRGIEQTAEKMLVTIASGIVDQPDRRAFTREFSTWTFSSMIQLMTRIRQIRNIPGVMQQAGGEDAGTRH